LGGPLPADVVTAGEGLGCATGRQVEPRDRLAVELAEAAADGQVGHRGQGGVTVAGARLSVPSG